MLMESWMRVWIMFIWKFRIVNATGILGAKKIKWVLRKLPGVFLKEKTGLKDVRWLVIQGMAVTQSPYSK